MEEILMTNNLADFYPQIMDLITNFKWDLTCLFFHNQTIKLIMFKILTTKTTKIIKSTNKEVMVTQASTKTV